MEGEREGEKHQCVAALHALSTGDLAGNLDMCPDWELNWRSSGSQAGTQSTEPHQLRFKTLILKYTNIINYSLLLGSNDFFTYTTHKD